MNAKSWMLGGLAVLFVVAAGGWVGSRQAMQDEHAQATAIAEYNEAAQMVIEQRRDREADERVSAESAEMIRAWEEQHAQKLAGIRGINDAKAREIDLLQEQQAAREEIAKARNAREMAGIGVIAD